MAGEATPQDAPAASPRPRHRFIISIRDHANGWDQIRARSTVATWLGIPAAEQAAMTAEDWAQVDKIIDNSNGQIHDRRTSAYMALRAATPEEVALAGPTGRACPAARGNAGTEAGDAGRTHRWLRSLFNNQDSCHWAYRSKN